MSRMTILMILGLLLLGGLFPSRPAEALHDQGYICYICHSLNPGDIRPGSNSILRIPAGNILGSIPTKPTRTDLPLPGTNGYPISCDFCHSSGSDVPAVNFASKTYKHPVDLIQTGDNTSNPQEITCNDCHNGNNGGTAFPDLTPSTLIAKTTTDGYPDHDNVNNVYAHDLTNNPPHLTQPYWSSTLPGVTRANDTTFWTAVRNNTLTPTDGMVCWVCHSTSSSPFTAVTSTKNVKADYTGTGTAKGHQIKTSVAGAMQPGAALPCYDCHDSHGSVNRGLVLDNQSIYGASTAAVAVTSYVGAARPYPDRFVCAQCHDTGNTATAATKAVPAQAGKIVEGLYPVDPFNSTSTASLHSSAGIADNMANSTKNCLANNGGCHASPHNPVGESTGGQNCSACHSGIYAAMDNGSSTGYHHVMMSDAAPSGANYPTTQQPTGTASTRTCTICHVDHNYFSKLVNANNLRAKNLRADITLQPDNVVANQLPRQTDFDNTQSKGGICTSCHELTQAKNSPGTNIKNDGTTTTPVVSLSYFNPSAHNYGSSSPYIQGHFTSDNADANSYYRANCTKCHNDTLGTSFQDGSYRFALHNSDNVNKLLAPLGYTPTSDNLSENFCYRCHSHQTDAVTGTKKTVDGSDWYNNRAMTQAAENVWGDFQKSSRHPVAAADQKGGTAVVDCLNCHNVHLTRTTTGSMVANPDNTYAFDNYVLTDNTQAGKQNRARFCLKCHDGAPPAYTVSGTQYIPLTVRLDNALMNKWAWGGLPDNTTNRGHWNVSGQFLSTSIVTCDACHNKHGSTIPKLLETTINAQAVTGNDNTVCQSCHSAAGYGYPAQEANRTAGDNGYFNPTPVAGVTTTTRWPGFTAWGNATYSPHFSTAKSFGGFDGISRNVNDCRTCHDVHGTANAYNLLKGTHTATNFGLCFQCHGKTSTATDNISKYFPSAAGGDNADLVSTTNVGHNIKTAGGYLSAGSALPCYDCHVTHGSQNNNTQLKSDQRWSGVGDTKYGAGSDNANRTFCLGCHMATDNVVAGTVENLDRQGGKLKLPALNAIVEHAQGSTQGCFRCHYGKNYNDNTWGPHYPATGLCDTCHESQGARSAAAATWNGAHRTHTDNAGYGFACKQCHSWTATVSPAVHKDNTSATQRAQVVFDNQATSGWDNTLRYALPFAYEYRSIYNNPYTGVAAVPTYAFAGVDNTTPDGRPQSSVRWTNGTCSTVWCHSNANPLVAVQGALGVSNVYQSPTWLLNSLSANCTGCHGGDATSGRKIGDNTAPTNGSIAHLKHINGGLGCYKCHNNTVKTTNGRQIDNLAGHLNASKDVVFDPSTVGGTWDNATKSCSATYCHGNGGGTLPRWDNLATVTGCSVCHQSNGAGNTFTYTGPHQTHTDNATYKTACEVCHSNYASGAGPNAVHADGDNSVGLPRTVQVAFTDCAANQAYNARLYYSSNMKSNPHTGLAVTPSYTENAAFVGGDNDAVNASISWSRGSCNNVWCHSNANPLTATGGVRQNKYRTPQWSVAQPCTYCHSGPDTSANMGLDNGNLSAAHIQHVATNFYGFTCDECHARTAANDCTVAINGATGYDNHVNGIKSVFFSTTLRTTTISQLSGTYDNVTNRNCSNTYCHSTGMDNATFASVTSPRWDNVNIPNCTFCHGGTAASGIPIMTQAHDNHVNNAATLGQTYACNRCHNATVAADNVTISSYTLHVNGYKNVSFPVPADNGSYVNGTKTCTTYCHRQGEKLLGAADNLAPTWDCTVDTSCKTCHGSKTGAGYHVSYLGEPNYDNNVPAGVRNSHDRHVSATDTTTRCQVCHPTANPTTVNTLATDNWALHINDNVDVRAGNGASFTWTPGTYTCSGISCHNGGTAQWGAALNCYDCHVGTGDLDDYGTGTFASMNNGLAARVDNTEWTTRGHGRTTASGNYLVTAHPPADFAGTGQCVYCHNSAIAHDNTSNPFRLANFDNPAGSGWNGVCMVCHRKTPAPSGYDPDGGGSIPSRNSTTTGTRVDTAHYGAKHSSPDNNGGKFCYDCHDPHGDNNIFMIGSRVVRATDNTYGIPRLGNDNTYKPNVAFADNSSFANYADNASPYNKICNVCHYGADHYRYNFGDTHNRSGKCTTCHSHDDNFKGSGTCIVCHASAQGASPARRQVTGAAGDFMEATHHMTNYVDNTTDGAVQNVDCSKCHWEGWLSTDSGFPVNSAGKTNPAYHYADQSNNATAKYVQLRVWSTTTPPTAYSNLAAGTATEWRNDAVWNSATNAINLNRHCLGCHSSTIGAATPFSDGRSPRVRAWDNVDIGTKYLRNNAANTVKTHQYSNTTYNVVPPLNKALSPHFDLLNNQRGVGTNVAWANDDAAGASNTATGSVACFDCHNSHSSQVVGTTALPLVSYADNASLNAGLANVNLGGLLKKTVSGEGGYSTTYTPTANATMNWGAGSAMCFDCHVGSTAGGTPPKTYTSFGRTATQLVAGYYDPVQWRTGLAAGQGVWDNTLTWRGSFPFKDNVIKVTHFKNDSFIRALQTAPTTQLNGLCSRCHDPHGVTTNTAQVSNANYGSPALKGTWMTSPYFEDRPGERYNSTVSWNMNAKTVININNNVYNGTSVKGRGGPRMITYRDYNRPSVVGGGYGTTGGGTGNDGFFIDENTFGLVITSAFTWDLFGVANLNTNNGWQNLWNGGYRNPVPTITINRITETNAQFAGLCEKCHTPTSLVNTASKAANIITRAHRTVKGWDALAGGPAAADIFRSASINNTTNSGAFSQRMLGSWFFNNMAANFSDYRFVEDPSEPWSGFPFHWGVNLNRTAGQFVSGYVQTNYHQFPCSKCHTPHTSRLPRLLKTNCLDTGTVRGVNGGASNWGTTGSWVQRHSTNATNQYINRFRATSNATFAWTPARAVRCHQDAYQINGTAANDSRWNDITPW